MSISNIKVVSEKDGWQTCPRWLGYLAMFMSILSAHGQSTAPGGVVGASAWARFGDSSDFIGNYRSINLLKLKSQADTSIPPMQGATTVFLVLKPNFTVATGAQFFELGDIVLYDNQLTHGSSNTMLDFSDQQPKIITLTMQRSPRVKRNQAPSFQLVDSSLLRHDFEYESNI